MSAGGIVTAILAEADAEVRRILSEAQQHANTIIDRAHEAAQSRHDSVVASYRRNAHQEQARLRHHAEQEILKIINVARSAQIERILSETETRLQSIRTESHYPQTLERLYSQAMNALHPSLKSDELPIVLADERDKHLLNEQHGDVEIRYTLACAGGVIATSEDGRVVVDNTLESRFRQGLPYVQRLLLQMLDVTDV